MTKCKTEYRRKNILKTIFSRYLQLDRPYGTRWDVSWVDTTESPRKFQHNSSHSIGYGIQGQNRLAGIEKLGRGERIIDKTRQIY